MGQLDAQTRRAAVRVTLGAVQGHAHQEKGREPGEEFLDVRAAARADGGKGGGHAVAVQNFYLVQRPEGGDDLGWKP